MSNHRPPMNCPGCGKPMNCHAEKLVPSADPDDESGAALESGTVIDEAFTCSACGANASRRP